MSFQQGLSGLNASSKNLEVIGNNIANSSTFGAKSARAEFAAVYAGAKGSSTSSVGIGTTLAAVAQQFTQGAVTTTGNTLDLAINGDGFFQVADVRGAASYTRNGQFKLDRDGFIVTNAQGRLLGYAADANGVVQPGAGVPMQLPTGGVDPKPSSRATIELNLDSRLAITLPAAPSQIDFADASTYNNATSLTVYDAKGQDIALTFYFQKSADDTWNVYATANGTTLAGAANAPMPVTTINFPANGSSPTNPVAPVPIDVPGSVNAAGAQTEPILGLLLDVGQFTQFGSRYGVTNITQDGYTAGLLSSVTVEPDGVIMTRYSNGQSKPAGQIEMANFRNVQGLQPIGDNAWAATTASGDPVHGMPGEGYMGLLQSGALEESNVDLSAELVHMITAQREYQANAQTIKTMDQVLQTLVNLR